MMTHSEAFAYGKSEAKYFTHAVEAHHLFTREACLTFHEVEYFVRRTLGARVLFIFSYSTLTSNAMNFVF